MSHKQKCVLAVGVIVASTVVGVTARNGSADTATAVSGATSQTFAFTGANQSFVVPAGVTSIAVDAVGARGGDGSSCFDGEQPECGAQGTGGRGAHAASTVAVTPGEMLTVVIGGEGGAAIPGNSPPIGCFDAGEIGGPGTGGFGGGGAGGRGGCPSGGGGGGGGATWLLRGTTPILVAAGGGGGGGAGFSDPDPRDGGNGGSSEAAGGDGSGAGNFCPGHGGEPGIASAGGAGGGGGSGCELVASGSTRSVFGGAHATLTGCVGVDGFDGAGGAATSGGSGGDGGLEQVVGGAGGGGGGGGSSGGGGGGGGGANCSYVAAAAGGGAGGASLGATVVDGVNLGDGSMTITFSAAAAAPEAVTVAPRFTG